jgi:LmbE family N-acetylglucosaminyl deacetylase
MTHSWFGTVPWIPLRVYGRNQVGWLNGVEPGGQFGAVPADSTPVPTHEHESCDDQRTTGHSIRLSSGPPYPLGYSEPTSQGIDMTDAEITAPAAPAVPDAVTAQTWPPDWRRVLVVVAHPDDESFALGAILDRLVQDGAEVAMLCLTRGEASSLGADSDDLAAVRAEELEAAGDVIGMASTTALTHPDGGLAGIDPAVLAVDVDRHVELTRPQGILVFDPLSGVTGHPDHAAASLAAIAAAERFHLPVLGWALPQGVADTLNAEYGSAFVGYPTEDLLEVAVDRRRQRMAIACHASQAVPGSVLWRRLELLGDREYLRTPAPTPLTPGVEP